MFSLHHVALSVSNLKKSTDFYHCLGFDEIFSWSAEDGSVQITHLKLGEFFLELFCYQKFEHAPKSTHQIATDLPVIGIKHMALRVPFIHQAQQFLIAKGLADTVEITRGRSGMDYFFIKDPDGILLEIVEDNRLFTR